MLSKNIRSAVKVFSILLMSQLVTIPVSQAATNLKPFVLASESVGSLAEVTKATKEKLTKNGFIIVGEYAPFAKRHLIVVTNQKLQSTAAKSEHGGFGAGQ